MIEETYISAYQSASYARLLPYLILLEEKYGRYRRIRSSMLYILGSFIF